MIPVQNAAGPFQVEVVGGILVPRQIQQGIQVIQLRGILGRMLADAFQLGQFLIEHSCRFFVPFLLDGPVLHFLQVLFLHAPAQFVLDGLDLLLQEILPLLLVDVLAGFRLDGHLELQQLRFTGHDVEQAVRTLLDVVHLQHAQLVQQLEGEVGTDEIDQGVRLFQVAHGKGGLLGNVARILDDLHRQVLDGLNQGLKFLIILIGVGFFPDSDNGPQIRVNGGNVNQVTTLHALEDDRRGTVRHFQDTEDAGYHAHLV